MNGDYISKNRITEKFLELSRIDSLSFKERDMADALKKELEELEIIYFEDDAAFKIGGNSGNIYAFFEGNG